MSQLVNFLVAFPFLVSLLLFLVTHGKTRNVIVVAGCVVVSVASVYAAVLHGNGPTVFFGLPAGWVPGHALLVAEGVLTAFILYMGVRHRMWLAPLLALMQLGVSAWHELMHPGHTTAANRLMYVDQLSVVMVLIIGVIGCLICLYALGYMRDFHRHYPMIKGRRTSFFFLLFLFLAAMFGVVCCNDLPLMFFFWEITTLCSFLLIGYTGTKDAIKYSFNALNMNLLGGLGFAVALVLLGSVPDGLDLAKLTSSPASVGTVVLPALALLSLAGVSKSAQMPFSSWLLGAMYAPTPTSALLHSSTMVKAGVFLLIKLAPAMAGSLVGYGVAFTGLITFLFSSLVNTTERNTKKVLAYSTIGNLGLIVGCAGIGTPSALWIAIMVVIFHAVAKSLLFLVVGTLENRLYTKDMENFDNLVSRMPRVSLLALTGIAGMFMAPFGIVLAKWSAIRAFLDVPGISGALFLLVMAFGSSMTIFYWAKLLLKVLSMRRISEYERSVEQRVSGWEWTAESVHALLVILLAAGVGVLSQHVVTPYSLAAFRAQGITLFHLDALTVTLLVVSVLSLPALGWWLMRQPTFHLADVYMAGRNVDENHVMDAALGTRKAVTLRNYYLDGFVDGAKVFYVGTLAGAWSVCATIIMGLFLGKA